MGPIEQKPPSSVPPKAQPAEMQKKSKGYTLESLPTAIQQIITGFWPPEQAFKSSPVSKKIYTMLQDNSIWQLVARNLNIKLDDPKNARASLEKLFRSVNALLLRHLPFFNAEKLAAIKEPFEQNKAIEKYLQSKPNQTSCFQLLGNLAKKRDLNQTDIETVKMFIRNGVLDKAPLYEIRNALSWVTISSDYFQHPQIIKLILDRLKETGVAVATFTDLLATMFMNAPGSFDSRNKECINACLEGGVIITAENVGSTFEYLMALSEDQWDIFELFLKKAPQGALKDLNQMLPEMTAPPDFLLRTVDSRKIFGLQKALYGPILSHTKEKVLKDQGIPADEKDIEAHKEAIAIINSLTDENIVQARTAEEAIEILSDRLSFLPEDTITQIVNTHWDEEAIKKSVAAMYARAKEALSKIK